MGKVIYKFKTWNKLLQAPEIVVFSLHFTYTDLLVLCSTERYQFRYIYKPNLSFPTFFYIQGKRGKKRGKM